MTRTRLTALLALIAFAIGIAPAFGPSTAFAAKKEKKDSKKDAAAEAKPAGDEKPFDTVIKDFETVPGLFTFYRRAEDGKVYMELTPAQLDKMVLFAASLDQAGGERGFYAAQQLADFGCEFKRVGKSIHWVRKNTSFTSAAGTAQAKAIQRSFPDAIMSSAKIQSQPHPERKSVLIDAQELFGSRDLPGFAVGLSQAYEPTKFSFDKERSSVRDIHGFPENVLIDVFLHYTTDDLKVPSITLADGRSLPALVKYSLSSIPASTYKPRLADDRVGHFLVVHQDFSSDEPKTPYVRKITRWNLEKQDPAAAVSPPKQPIVFWLENTIPLEYRDAMREGTLLWNKAFEKAGFKDAVVVQQMPDDATWDPADVRYNVIRWFAGVDATFAIGPSRANPMTGEIYDADIGMSEGIIRNARRLGEEFVAPGSAAHEEMQNPASAWRKDFRGQCSYANGLADQAAFAIAVLDARNGLSPELEKKLMHEYILELTAHEVGHTLGLRHNFRASSILPVDDLYDVQKTTELSQSSSVMDYNPVLVAAKGRAQGHFVPVTLGPYDYWAIEYAYKPIDGDEKAGLAAIASRCADPMLPYSTDEDAIGTYSPWSMDPLANQYDQATDPLAYFKERIATVNELWATMDTRLAEPGEGYQILRRALARGLSDDFRSMVTSSKFVGGVYHRRDHVGDPNGRVPFEPVPAAKQKEALALLNDQCFGPKAFPLSASVQNKLAIERNYSLNPAYFQNQRLDYPWHQGVLNVQSSVMGRLLHPVTLARIQDNELRFGAGAPAFKMNDLFEGLNASVWSELDGAGREITSLRRNVQREHLRHLVRIATRQPGANTGFLSVPAGMKYPEDATTLARYYMERIQRKARARLAAGTALETTTRAHLQETDARIGAALAAQMEIKVD
jgi:Met-zincin/Domain of unknown function (DUF5117)